MTSAVTALLARFESDCLCVGSSRLYAQPVARRLVADATSKRLAVERLAQVRYDGRALDEREVAIDAPALDAEWMGTVFHSNSAAWAAIDRAPAGDFFVFQLGDRAELEGRDLVTLLEARGLAGVEVLGGAPAGTFTARRGDARVLVTLVVAPKGEEVPELEALPLPALGLRGLAVLEDGLLVLEEDLPADACHLEDRLDGDGLRAVLVPLGRALIRLHNSGALALGVRPDLLFVRGSVLGGFTPRRGAILHATRGKVVDALAAPELRAGGLCTAATDTYAYAATLRQVAAAPSPPLERAIERALSTDPAARGDVRDLVTSIELDA